MDQLAAAEASGAAGISGNAAAVDHENRETSRQGIIGTICEDLREEARAIDRS